MFMNFIYMILYNIIFIHTHTRYNYIGLWMKRQAVLDWGAKRQGGKWYWGGGGGGGGGGGKRLWVKNRGETTRGEMTRGKMSWGQNILLPSSSTLSSPKSSGDSVARFTSLVRSRD